MKAPIADRSNRAEVRNPVLAMPGVRRLQAMPQLYRDAMVEVMIDIRDDARRRADECWRKHKAPMAAYWKAVSVYANHIARALREPERRALRERMKTA